MVKLVNYCMILVFILFTQGACSSDTNGEVKEESNQEVKAKEAEAKKEAEEMKERLALKDAKAKKDARESMNRSIEAKKRVEEEAKKKAETIDIQEKTLGIDIAELKTRWENATTSEGLERITTISNEEIIEGKDYNVYKSQVNEYLHIQARLNKINSELTRISIITVPPEENQQNIQLDIIYATGVLLSVLQPDLTADERGDISITHLGLGLESTDLKTVDNEYVLNDVSYTLTNFDGLLFYSVFAGDIKELRNE